MQIERIETFPLLHRLSVPYGDANGYKRYRASYLLRITTRSGIMGWGEVTDWLPTLEKGFQERIIPFLLGKQATDRLKLVKVITKWHQRAASGVSMALMDIIARKAGLTICELWGGSHHQTIPVYASFQSYFDQPDWQKQSVQMVLRQVSDGFRQVKVKVGGRSLQEDQQHVKTLQQELQGSAQLAIDANQSYDLSTARQWEMLFSHWDNLLWLEEPFPMERTEEYVKLRATISIAVAGGENMQSGSQYVQLLRQGAVDIISPDPMHTDGIDAYRSILQLARDFGVRVSPHTFDGALSRLFAVCGQACLPAWSKMRDDSIEPVEWDVMENPLVQLFPLKLADGKVTVPLGVGIGVEPDPDILASFRWDGSTYT